MNYKTKFLIKWYYFFGDLVSRILNYVDSTFLAERYQRWMGKSSDYDTEDWFWKPDNG